MVKAIVHILAVVAAMWPIPLVAEGDQSFGGYDPIDPERVIYKYIENDDEFVDVTFSFLGPHGEVLKINVQGIPFSRMERNRTDFVISEERSHAVQLSRARKESQAVQRAQNYLAGLSKWQSIERSEP